MKGIFYCFALVLVVSATTVLADIDTDNGAVDTAGLLSAFNIASKSGQETSNGCTMNPMEGNQQVITNLLPLPTLQQVAYSSTYSASTDSTSSSQETKKSTPNRTVYPPSEGDTPPSTPEPGTLLIMGIGAMSLIPLLRRKRASTTEETKV